MKKEETQKFIKRIAKELKIFYPICNLPKTIVIKLNRKNGWVIELDEKKKTYNLIYKNYE